MSLTTEQESDTGNSDCVGGEGGVAGDGGPAFHIPARTVGLVCQGQSVETLGTSSAPVKLWSGVVLSSWIPITVLPSPEQVTEFP